MTLHALRSSLTVIILTYNEERHIVRCVESVKDIAAKVIVVDSFSTDSTVNLAELAGAEVVQHAFVNQAKQFKWALDNSNIDTDWVMRLDADELIEEDLRKKIGQDLTRLPSDVVGVNLDRKHVFMGKWIRHGGRYPVRLLRIWRRGHARIEDRWMDEHIFVTGGRTVLFSGGFSDVNLNNLTFFISKHNAYATREAVERLAQKFSLFERDSSTEVGTASRQAASKRWIKEHLFNRLPFWIGPAAYFFYRYTIQLGFLDGRAGLVYHFLQGFWYRFLVGAKVLELEGELTDCLDNFDRLQRLQKITGLKLEASL
jgi:glycosyltransferase involved in cell wall biosynthesis